MREVFDVNGVFILQYFAAKLPHYQSKSLMVLL